MKQINNIEKLELELLKLTQEQLTALLPIYQGYEKKLVHKKQTPKQAAPVNSEGKPSANPSKTFEQIVQESNEKFAKKIKALNKNRMEKGIGFNSRKLIPDEITYKKRLIQVLEKELLKDNGVSPENIANYLIHLNIDSLIFLVQDEILTKDEALSIAGLTTLSNQDSGFPFRLKKIPEIHSLFHSKILLPELAKSKFVKPFVTKTDFIFFDHTIRYKFKIDWFSWRFFIKKNFINRKGAIDPLIDLNKLFDFIDYFMGSAPKDLKNSLFFFMQEIHYHAKKNGSKASLQIIT